MKYWNCQYYIGLLSAAAYYGAAHQQPQVFQVVTTVQRRTIHCGNVRVQFIKNKHLNKAFTQKFNVPTGDIIISSPETTAMDMLTYQQHAGGLNHIATVLSELLEAIDSKRLLELANQSFTIAWIQRLGYLLEVIEPENIEHRDKLVALLRQYVKEKKPRTIPLNLSIAMKGFPRNSDWNVAINTEVESDI
jgi:predicted transcriptional regulator of viral defense system